jgi:hypothetical protein
MSKSRQDQDQSAEFYASRGQSRYMIITKLEVKDRLKEIGKRYGISQGDVVDVLVENTNFDSLVEQMEDKRSVRLAIDGRVKTDLAKRISLLSPEKQAEIERILTEAA